MGTAATISAVPVAHLIPRYGSGPMRMPALGPLTVVESQPDGVALHIEREQGLDAVAVVLDAQHARRLAEQILFVIDGSVIVATNRVEGY